MRRFQLVPDCRSSRTHSLTVVARKLLLSRARKQGVKYANFCNLVLGLHLKLLVAGAMDLLAFLQVIEEFPTLP